MDGYRLIEEVGQGSYGKVWRALDVETGEIVAVKVLKQKYESWEQCLKLPEVKCLRRLKHPNIVKLNQLIMHKDRLFFVFENMDCNLKQLMKTRVKKFSEAEVRNYCFQIFQGLAYMHRQGYFHRDLKLENLLVSLSDRSPCVKIADFGMARQVSSNAYYTNYVATLWYRAPELLFFSRDYTPAIDMWAMGAIMAELFTFKPLFPGSNTIDQISKICSVIGSPNQETWEEGIELAYQLNFEFPQLAGVDLGTMIPSASKEAVSLIKSLCSWDAWQRPTAEEALRHPFFAPCFGNTLKPQLPIPHATTANSRGLRPIEEVEAISTTELYVVV